MSTTRTVGHEFDLLELAFREGGPDAVFERLVRTAREEQGPRDLFAIRVMQVRHRLGLPLIETEKVLDLDDETAADLRNGLSRCCPRDRRDVSG